MTYFPSEWQSIPVAEWERIEAVIDAARAVATARPGESFTYRMRVLRAAVRALEGDAR